MRGKGHYEKVLGLALACLGAAGCSQAGLATEKGNSLRVVPADEVAFRRPFPVAPEMADLWGGSLPGRQRLPARAVAPTVALRRCRATAKLTPWRH